MVMITSLFLAGLMFALAKGDTSISAKPAMASLQVQQNFDFSLAHKEFRVHYSGLGDGFAHTTGDQIHIKIYKPNGDLFHTYEISEEKKDQKKAYYFALNDADEDGEYKVEVCSGEKCSGKTPALTDIKSNQPMVLTCVKGNKKLNEDKVEVWTTTGQINLNFNGPSIDDWIETDQFDKIENELNTALQNAKVGIKYQTDFKKHKLTANPTYEKKTFYAAIQYNVAQYKELFDKSIGVGETRNEYSHDKCKRKYLLSSHVHLVDTDTKEVKYRFKTTLNLSGFGKKYFVMDEEAKDRKVHVEMVHENVEIDAGSYKIHVIFCATDKDTIESTFCAPPVIYNGDDLVVKSAGTK